MIEILTSPLFYLFLTIGVYFLFAFLQKKTKIALFNPLLWTIIVIAGYIIAIVAIDHNGIEQAYLSEAVIKYQESVSILDYLFAPVTVALALPLYLNRHVLKQNWLAILVGTLVGVGSSIGAVILLGNLLQLDQGLIMALYPRGVTTAIAKEVTALLQVSEFTSITVAVVVITGIVGALFGPLLIKLFRDKDDIVVGLSLGSASHAMGTSKAFDYSSKAGAIASVSMVTNGLVTVIVAIIISLFLR